MAIICFMCCVYVQNETQLKNEVYTSNPGALSTSECDCFDGTEFTSDDETPLTFDRNDIHDQGVVTFNAADKSVVVSTRLLLYTVCILVCATDSTLYTPQ